MKGSEEKTRWQVVFTVETPRSEERKSQPERSRWRVSAFAQLRLATQQESWLTLRIGFWTRVYLRV